MPPKQIRAGKIPGTRKKGNVDSHQNGLYVVGIGASAGGLDAINTFFDNIPSDSAAYIVVQHISSEYKSLMKELISRHTSLTVLEAEEGLEIKPDNVYVIPAKKHITAIDGSLHLVDKPEKQGGDMAVDLMLKSLAKSFKERAIAVILSGAGTDGAMGVDAIKKENGLVIVQEPSTAMFDSMPKSAINTGLADFVLPPDAMAEEIAAYIHFPASAKFYNEKINQKEAGILSEILLIVRNTTGRDFTQYKQPTIIRRLKRRMMLTGYSDFDSYKNFLKNNEDEANALCKEFLISVTRFFRDPASFEELAEKVIPEIINKKGKGQPLKIWVVGCATGEEAYSIAILAKEYLESTNKSVEVKIFASDIDQAAIETAGKGIYGEQIEADVSKERLEKFFTKTGKRYKINPDIRKMLVFTLHDALNDPPFGKIDLLICRNLLIYLSPDLQKRLLSTFLFSLVPGGYLFLGNSENKGDLNNSMIDVSLKSKIFQRSDSAPPVWLPTYLHEKPFIRNVSNIPVKENAKVDFSGLLSETILEEFGTVGVYVDENYEILQAFGDFKNYLRLPEKLTGFNLLKMVPDSLSIALGNGISKVIKSKKSLTIKGVDLREGKDNKTVNVFLKPVDSEKLNRKVVLILFTEEKAKKLSAENQEIFNKEVHFNNRLQSLESELKETKSNLQSAIEQLETTNEELQSANEELLSANEELQSTNEELQSLNEELYTVNNEHTLKIQELEELYDDLGNYFRAADIGQLFVDRDLKLRKYTPAATSIINITESDIGRPISHFSNNIKNADLVAEIKKVIAKPGEILREVQSDGKWYQLKIIPYVRFDNRLDGAVATFTDITQMRQLNEVIAGVTENSPNGIIALSANQNGKSNIEYKLLFHNPKAEEILGLSAGIQKNTLPANSHLMNESLVSAYTKVIKTGKTEHLEQVYKDTNGTKWLHIGIAKMGDGVVLNIEDITDRKNLEKEKEKYFDELSSKNSLLQHWAYIAENNLRDPLRAIKSFAGLLKKKTDGYIDPETREFVGYMVDGAEEMEGMIMDLLEYSEIDSSKKPMQNVESEKLVEFATHALREKIKESKAKVSVDTKMPEIYGVATHLTKVFQHLISNAIKFAQPGKDPEIHIGCEGKGEFWQFYVKDNGIGFDMKLKDKLFKIFQRLNDKAKYPGSGIGLATCKKIVERHGGKIRVDSAVGKGSTFYFTIPKIQLTRSS